MIDCNRKREQLQERERTIMRVCEMQDIECVITIVRKRAITREQSG